ncbi:1-(5-phosphoribosyl)-5-amino-4-imidazole-carboxylate carboxylase [Candidatus Desantisbacteria bacterium CG_4_10_14_0_8_um_filter_48_22]|uniref:1-(5-phosphoribosyl)-5-amino-4-imidazole-carboxylate carboxylase n=1 Tax=Candidatus Desantisbacteria bacterium CG_4_10_14_0_8_um_filter_48_22 TaxID=1974543 RepID=A0A2M7S756_9BACT|nr:MAG: 1-(5-phosphoribosyl)-5-amino-4-imidazole-carboxylate carboxylase [Candidatus Desantisbacteria bacterium CG1_02_49_89]PIV55551.1 MAG: 1-(5-phosphoribosyl)-5-amino-4-imidazole-carboxylate carboxylase [Candidatus Desantisbacteria bacterium CG02_land_8_20_14_3_00_49_13]PIZ15289.1 MAG: 1-(5-phosphoribosyl)-5-amino-4-imidazole-carboxylate carboxylase [Candidatus Desantisbacteria bacterium CG_4_10_14_0_8_um_filter_48_22]PJB27510.1 MAG: 1-(5-phosphoribosyl)-5-amino-4-imidazole-carboxylate carbox
MSMDKIERLLKKIRAKKLGVKKAMEELKLLPYEDIGFAKIDHHRKLRKGVPEVVFCPGKKPEHIALIMSKILRYTDTVLATRASPDIFKLVQGSIPDAIYFEDAGIVAVCRGKKARKRGRVLVVSAGSGDFRAAEEAAVVLELLGNRVDRLYDVGVAGLHRLISNKDKLSKANVIIVLAGMEGALASVVGGLTDKPVIAVPTSIGYGASFRGIAPLLTMLNCCAPGVTVVNIDNGFGAGYFAHLINK